ncbi:MAG: DUF1009 domain-containing protein [Verrucomicrobia bacterium]|nr:MAG: DUF1009 domain-containing protein [Verrucomicrobiota bacterium]
MTSIPSRFLPAEFDRSKPVAVIAGNGLYPGLTVDALRQLGIPVRLIGFFDETIPELVESFPESERRILHVGQLGKMLRALRDFQAGYAIMAGQITPKRLFQGLRPDLKTTTILLRLKKKNAETIFGAIAEEIDRIGIRLLDARAFLDAHLASVGVMTGRQVKCAPDVIDHGVEIAREVARLDIGQGVVVRKGTVVAVEAFEGTDEMLRRAGTFKTDGLVFVKTVKPRQDFRFDVPVFGRRTLEVMRESSITLAVLEAENTLILEREAVIAQANAWGIDLMGVQWTQH